MLTYVAVWAAIYQRVRIGLRDARRIEGSGVLLLLEMLLYMPLVSSYY
jgi:hypothetical protein